MFNGLKHGSPRRRHLPGRSGRGDPTRKFRVKTHYRTPRGADAGKPRVRVRAYRRGAPRKGPFAH